MRVQISISPKFTKQLAMLLSLVVVGLAVLSLTFEFLNFYLFSDLASQAGDKDGNFNLLYLPSDGNIPEWYSSSMLLICAILLAMIAIAVGRSRYIIHWVGLSILFLYLSADEAASIHEKLSSVLEGRLNTSGILYYAWVIPYAAFVLVFVCAYLMFFINLPANTRLLFLIAGLFYVGGALGGELIEGYYTTLYGASGLIYSLIMHAEEVLEMLGVVVFFYALLLYISSHVREINIGSKF